jgi:hypothetical protein
MIIDYIEIFYVMTLDISSRLHFNVNTQCQKVDNHRWKISTEIKSACYLNFCNLFLLLSEYCMKIYFEWLT